MESTIILKNSRKAIKGVYGKFDTSLVTFARKGSTGYVFPLNPTSEKTGWFTANENDVTSVGLNDQIIVSVTYTHKRKVNTTNPFEVLNAQKGKDADDNARSVNNLASDTVLKDTRHYAVSLQDNGKGGVRWFVHSEVAVSFKDGNFSVTPISYSDYIGYNAGQIAQIVSRLNIS